MKKIELKQDPTPSESEITSTGLEATFIRKRQSNYEKSDKLLTADKVSLVDPTPKISIKVNKLRGNTS